MPPARRASIDRACTGGRWRTPGSARGVRCPTSSAQRQSPGTRSTAGTAPQIPRRWPCGAGSPASVALFAGDKIYYATDIPLQSRQNPLHAYLFTGARVAPKRSCRSRAVRGTIAAIDAGGVFIVDGRRIRVGSETRLRTDAVDGVPRLRPGTAVTVRARSCHGSVRANSVTSAPW